MRLLTMGLAYAGQYLKRQMSYRFNFIVQAISLVAWSGVNLALVGFLFQKVPAIQGWEFGQVLLIYGIAHTAFGLSFMCCCNLLWLPSRYIVEGQLDRLLVRPMDPFLQLLMEEASAEDLVFSLMGVAIITYALHELGKPFAAATVLLTMLMVLSGSAVFAGIMTIASCASFWLKDRVGLMGPMIDATEQTSRYPITIYPTWLRLLLSTILPFAFVAFYPAQALAGRPEYAYGGYLAPLLGAGVMAVGYGVWRAGLRCYESTGS